VEGCFEIKNTTREDDINFQRHMTEMDNVHFPGEGYENLAWAIHININM
jgi:hypothetical protein